MVQIASSYASTLAKYSPDNQTAFAQTSAYVPPPAPQQWIDANSDKKFYLEKSGENSYKLGSVSGSASKIPANTVAVDLNVAYAIESKELSLVDWAMARIGDEIRRENALQAFGSLLSLAPEADLSFDTSSMSQADLTQLLKRLSKASDDLRATTALGNMAERQAAAAKLGLSATLLSAAMEQQALFGTEAATLPEALAVGSARSTLEIKENLLFNAQTKLTTATLTSEAARSALAADPGNETLKSAYTTVLKATEDAQKAVDDASKARSDAAAALAQSEVTLAAADNFNEVMSAAYAQLVAGLSADLEAAQVAYSQTAASTVSSSTLSGLTSAAGNALNSRLKSAADVALLTSPNVALFSALDVQETDDGYVVNTSGMSSRDAQKAAVRAALEEALSDPALQTALADAMAANADSLGTADMALPDQTKLYNEVAAAMISSMRSNDGYLDELASNAVDFGNQLSQMLGNELVSASKRDNALLSAMN